jgi:hypothetical protein
MDVFTHGYDVACQLMPEQSGRNDHACVVTAAKHLHVGAARQRRLDAYQYVAIPDAWYGNGLNLQVLFAIQHGGFHFCLH